MTLEIEKLTPVLGARVGGLSIRDGVDDATIAEIAAALDEYSVLHFPDQPATDDQQIAFTGKLGPLEGTVVGSVGAGSPIARISNIMPDGTVKDPDGQRALFTRANEYWHTDSSFKPVPAKASLLSAREIPAAGGDTEYCSTRAGYEALPDETKARIEGLIAIHSLEQSRSMLSADAMTDAQKAENPPVHQALVRVNPRTGRKSLMIGSHFVGIVGMDNEEAMELWDELMASATRPEFVYRHKWNADDMVMWDNRAAMHRATPYDEVKSRRIMIRTTLAGAGPTVVDGEIQVGV